MPSGPGLLLEVKENKVFLNKVISRNGNNIRLEQATVVAEETITNRIPIGKDNVIQAFHRRDPIFSSMDNSSKMEILGICISIL